MKAVEVAVADLKKMRRQSLNWILNDAFDPTEILWDGLVENGIDRDRPVFMKLKTGVCSPGSERIVFFQE